MRNGGRNQSESSNTRFPADVTFTYWSAIVDGTVHDDVAWSYEDTPPETLPIRGFLSFDETRADVSAQLPTG